MPADPHEPSSSSRSPLFGVLPWPERTAIARALRTETVGGLVLLASALIALIWANTPVSGVYESLRDLHFGIPALGLDLSVQHWTADGLLAVFFLVAGIELKRELVVGELRTPATAVLPVVAAVCGMAVPAAVCLATVWVGGGSPGGWAVPMATDIAFALAVLAVISTHLPAALRAFLLTLAVVDDLGAILVIAVFFTADLNLWALAAAFAGLAVFYLLQRYRVRGWWWYLPLGVTIWALMYNSGVHATVAGVAMGLILRIRRDQAKDGCAAEAASPGERTAHLLRPVSAGIAVPLFALFAAGVSLSGPALGAVFTQPEPLGIVLGLVVGKTVGVFAGTYVTARFTRARLNPDLTWADVLALAVLAGIGFTVALLIGELAFTDPAVTAHIKAAVLVSSLIAAILATLLVRRRNAIYRRLNEAENLDADADGIPDIYQHDQPSTPASGQADARPHRRLNRPPPAEPDQAGHGTRPAPGHPRRARPLAHLSGPRPA
ncbi:Na+/H+ antiporter NhaA [Streptomyces sp. NPDC005251]|uniref:Na+/H+ antiporter NhaA n=1 Tax=Streptomyces sp. NPDC005251 TaxID=3157166 RepID=UPI0033B94C9A